MSATNVVKLSVLTSASALPLSYQWYGRAPASYPAPSDWMAIPQATNATLWLNATNAGFYAVMVSNALGAVISEPVKAPAWSSPEPVRLNAVLDSQARQLHLTVQGAPGPNAVIQSSTNLRDWQDWTTVVCTNGTGTVIESAAGSRATLFYRAVVQ